MIESSAEVKTNSDLRRVGKNISSKTKIDQEGIRIRRGKDEDRGGVRAGWDLQA
jgi:hypothetical protein